MRNKYLDDLTITIANNLIINGATKEQVIYYFNRDNDLDYDKDIIVDSFNHVYNTNQIYVERMNKNKNLLGENWQQKFN